MHFKGFTLVEILIVIGILATIGITVLPNFFKATALQELKGGGDRVVAVLRDAQARSLSAEDQKTWGVEFDADNKKFSMSTYVSGSFELPAKFINLKDSLEFRDPISGTKKIIFNGLTGEPIPKNPVTIIIGLTNDPSNFKTITVYANGSIEIQ